MREFPKDTTSSPSKSHVEHVEDVPSPSTTQNESRYSPTSPGQYQCPPSHHSRHIRMPRESNLDIFLSNLDLGTFEWQTNNYQTSVDVTVQPGYGPLLLDRAALEQLSIDIRTRLGSAAVSMNVPNAPPRELLDSIQGITAKNIAIWSRLYFRHFHKHGPIVHEATYNPAAAALPLVLAIISIGAMASPLMHFLRTFPLTMSLVFRWGD
jgi:hypothetical protein